MNTLITLPDICLINILKNIPAGELITKVSLTCHRLRFICFHIYKNIETFHIATFNSTLGFSYDEERTLFDITRNYDLIVLVRSIYNCQYFTPNVRLFCFKDVLNFQLYFPNITSLSISGCITTNHPILVSLISAYPNLKSLKCYGKFDLKAMSKILKELPKLKHFTHLFAGQPFIDKTYREEIPDVLERLETLHLDCWSDSYGLPKNIKDCRFLKAPVGLYSNPQNFLKFTGFKQIFEERIDFNQILDIIPNLHNTKNLFFVFHFLSNNEKFFYKFFKILEFLPKVNVIVFADIKYFFETKNDSKNSKHHLIREQINSQVIKNALQFDNIKYFKISGLKLPFDFNYLRLLFPNAILDYKHCKECLHFYRDPG